MNFCEILEWVYSTRNHNFKPPGGRLPIDLSIGLSPFQFLLLRGTEMRRLIIHHPKREEEMDAEKRLYDAAIEGNAEALKQLLHHDPLILDKVTLRCSDRTHFLHIAAMLGHVYFVGTILDVSFDMGLARDRDGRNPFHLAAINGKLGVLEVLIQTRPLFGAGRGRQEKRGSVLWEEILELTVIWGY